MRMLCAVDETPEQWKDRLGVGKRSNIGRSDGDTRTTFVPHEDGGVGGTQTEHRDGRVDATVFARPHRISTTMPRPM